MSYCVHCGVELEVSEKACPLCGTEVCNPRQPFDARARRPYPSHVDPITERINRQFIVAIISILLAFPALLVVIIDLFYTNALDWSLIVAGALAMIWVFVCPALLMRRPTFLKFVVPSVLAVLGFLRLLNQFYFMSGWYLGLALPIVLITSLIVLIIGVLIERQILRGFAIPAAILIGIGLLVSGIELIVNRYLNGVISIQWSLFVLIPCLALAAITASIARRRNIQDEISKRLHL